MAETLTGVLYERAKTCPDEVPVILGASGESDQDVPITYAQIFHRARVIATCLERLRPGHRVLLAYPTGLEFIAAFFGAMYAGAIPVPVPPPLPGVLATRYNQILADCDPDLVLTQSDWAGLFNYPRVLVTDRVPGPAGEISPLSASPADVAYLQYTSGTTGAPKGVLVTHQNALAAARMSQAAAGLQRGELASTWLPNWHDMGLATSLIVPVTALRTVLVTQPEVFAADPLRWLRQMSRRHARSATLPCFAYDMLARRTTPEERAELDLSYWRQAACGAEVADPTALRAFTEAFAAAGVGPDIVYGAYGMAETVMMAATEAPGGGHTVLYADREALAAGRLVPRPGGIPVSGSGRPLPEVDLLVAHRRARTPCPPGTVGEIMVAGPNVCSGYWGRPDPYVTVTGRRYLPTGDLGALLDGELFVLGRVADLITVDGRQHYPAHIERTIVRSVPFIRASTCTAFQDGDSVVVAVELSDSHSTGIADAIRAAVSREHGIQRASVVLARSGGIPLTTSKKLCRAECRSRHRSRLLPLDIADSRGTGVFMTMNGTAALYAQACPQIRQRAVRSPS